MATSTRPPAAPETRDSDQDSLPERSRLLPSGRSVVLKVAGDREELEIRNADGELEVSVVMTADGPLVRVCGGRLELNAVDDVAVRCKRFEVETTESTVLSSAGDLRMTGSELKVRTIEDIHLNGAFIRLNC
jgi:hypothetical protein